MQTACLAAQREPRNRGISITEQRAADAAAAAAAEQQRRQARADGADGRRDAPHSGERPAGACKLGRGRAALTLPLALGGGVQAVEDRKASLMEKAEFRPTKKVTAVAPAGAGKLDELPDRMNFEIATAAGAADFTNMMLEFVEKNFAHAGIEARSADQHELKTGFFGYWHEKRGHGRCEQCGGSCDGC